MKNFEFIYKKKAAHQNNPSKYANIPILSAKQAEKGLFLPIYCIFKKNLYFLDFFVDLQLSFCYYTLDLH